MTEFKKFTPKEIEEEAKKAARKYIEDSDQPVTKILGQLSNQEYKIYLSAFQRALSEISKEEPPAQHKE